MIYIIGIGSNMSSKYGSPIQSLKVAIKKLKENNIQIIKKSSLYSSPPKDFCGAAHHFINGAIIANSSLKPENLLLVLKKIENHMGRNIYKKNTSRTCDLDMLLIWPEFLNESKGPKNNCNLPHPRLHEREFVLKPMMDICPNWIHAVIKERISDIYKSRNLDDKVYKISQNL